MFQRLWGAVGGRESLLFCLVLVSASLGFVYR